jgi:hypothetical protein
MRCAGSLARIEMRITNKILFGNQRPVGRWKDNIKMDLNGTGSEDMDWIRLA